MTSTRTRSAKLTARLANERRMEEFRLADDVCIAADAVIDATSTRRAEILNELERIMNTPAGSDSRTLLHRADEIRCLERDHRHLAEEERAARLVVEAQLRRFLGLAS